MVYKLIAKPFGNPQKDMNLAEKKHGYYGTAMGNYFETPAKTQKEKRWERQAKTGFPRDYQWYFLDLQNGCPVARHTTMLSLVSNVSSIFPELGSRWNMG